MTKQEFLQSVPKAIKRGSSGYADLAIIVDKPGEKGICYKHGDNTTSCGTYASSWEGLHEKLVDCLDKTGCEIF